MDSSHGAVRFNGRLLPPASPPPRWRTPEERASLLYHAITMAEIRGVADLLGLTFNEAYQERAIVYQSRVPVLRWGAF
jgi:hypothetical protein